MIYKKQTYLLLFTFCMLVVSCKKENKLEFKDELTLQLMKAIEQFKPGNKAFILNIMTNNRDILFQIVHTSFRKETRKEDDRFGFALQLTFPPHFPETQDYEKFKKLSLSKQFKMYYFECIPCYVVDFDTDVQKTTDFVLKILNEVYDIRDYRFLTTELTDEGEIKNWLQQSI